MELTTETIRQELRNELDRREQMLDLRFREIDKRFEKLEAKVDSIKTELEAKVDSVKPWFVSLSFTTIFAVIGVLALIK